MGNRVVYETATRCKSWCHSMEHFILLKA